METVKLYNLNFNYSNNYNFSTVYNELINFANYPIGPGTHLLDYKNIEYKENINFIEKFVYDTAVFQLKQYNIYNKTNYNIQDIFVEFWGLNDTHFKAMHMDKDEQEFNIDRNITTYGKPFLSCITYLTDDNNYAPTIITDLIRIKNGKERDDYYNGKHNDFGLIFPRKMKQITFDGGNYFHGMLLMDKKCNYRVVLPINFWFKRPKYLSYFPYHTYIRKHYPKNELFNIYKTNKSITKEPLFSISNIDMQINNVIIKVNKEELQYFTTWYKQLIFGDDTIDFSILQQYINKNDYIYKFKFLFT